MPVVRDIVRFSIILALFLAGCGASAPRATPIAPSPPAPAAIAPRFEPRLVRHAPASQFVYSRIEVAGVGRREVSAIDDAVRVFDPDTGISWAVERFGSVSNIELDPSFWRACVILDRARVGAFDLRTREWLWTRELPYAVRVAATSELCVMQTHEGMRVFDLESGEPRAIDVPPWDLSVQGHAYVLWSRDLTRRYDRVLAFSATGPAWLDALRDGATLARRETFWTSCIDASGEIDRIGLHATEDETRRAHLARAIHAEWIECAPPTELDSIRQVQAELPAPWIPLADGRLVLHGAHGLFLFDWAARSAPLRLTDAPVERYRDVNGQSRPVEPVIGDGWIGAIDAQGSLARFDLSGAPLPPIALPTGPNGEYPPSWQVFAAPGDRLLAIRDVNGRRTAFVSSARGWTRSRARTFSGIWQYAEWRDDHWLLSDPHNGIQLVDPERGAVIADFTPPDAYSRISRATPSPDGTRLAVIVGPWSDDWEGVYVLDARTLAVLAHHPGDRSLAETHDALGWDAQGIVVATRAAGVVVGPRWVRIDPASGERREAGTGTPRASFGHRRTGGVHVSRTAEGDPLVAPRAIDEEVAIVSIGADGSGAVQTLDGRVWCEGACPQYRCVVDTDRVEPFDHPACASTRMLAE
ncbi:hypothetical protein [Sandaracinus amylolyticus]|uniref:hypothetical protein n=1 Tax=Sandaracinus amylolyticus TaxID=927083 RepID=UPI001F3E2B50|nr:hypothetical protein [Sandaracinus amylolyticus]UJR85337.1 Hypothetical protein I5071_74170 [Sandaracinus amylolyticus]